MRLIRPFSILKRLFDIYLLCSCLPHLQTVDCEIGQIIRSFLPYTGHSAPVCSKALDCSCDPICDRFVCQHSIHTLLNFQTDVRMC